LLVTSAFTPPTVASDSPVADENEAASGISRRAALLADLSLEQREALRSTATETLLEEIYRTDRHRFDAGPLIVRADRRWFARVPEESSDAPLVELWRWPGDTAVALYAVEASRDAMVDLPPVADTRWESRSMVSVGQTRWDGWLLSERGDRPVIWIERDAGSDLPHLAALVVPGDAGLGPEAVPSLIEEALFLVSRVTARGEPWARIAPLPKGEVLTAPATGGTPGDKSETDHPWQLVDGRGFTLSVPPGIRPIRLDAGVRPPVEVSGGLLWFRGRFRDLDDRLVIVGDGSRCGYVARVEVATGRWLAGKIPPIGAPDAERVASFAFETAAERSGARKATAGRWNEPGFEGTWLVFRLAFATEGFEIGIPVARGWQSTSLFWIAPTWRSADRPPAPSPVGPDQRFDIHFTAPPFSRTDAAWYAGQLELPGLTMEIAWGWHPVPNTYSSTGFPIRFVDSAGSELATLTRVASDLIDPFVESRSGWVEQDGPERHHARRVLREGGESGLFVPYRGAAFYLSPSIVLDDPAAPRVRGLTWRQAWELMLRSVRLVSPPPTAGDAPESDRP
jgi:hypothetical protein